jgi:hypothetical protein
MADWASREASASWLADFHSALVRHLSETVNRTSRDYAHSELDIATAFERKTGQRHSSWIDRIEELAEMQSRRWDYFSAEAWALSPLYFELRGRRRGRKVRALGAERDAWMLGRDADGVVVATRQPWRALPDGPTGWDTTVYQWSDTNALAMRVTRRAPSAYGEVVQLPKIAVANVGAGQRIVEIRELGSSWMGTAEFKWDEDRVQTVRWWGSGFPLSVNFLPFEPHEQQGPDVREADVQYDSSGVIASVNDSRTTAPLYLRSFRAPERRRLVARLQATLLRSIPDAIRSAFGAELEAEPALTIAILHQLEQTPRSFDLLLAATTPEEQARLGGRDNGVAWSPAEWRRSFTSPVIDDDLHEQLERVLVSRNADQARAEILVGLERLSEDLSLFSWADLFPQVQSVETFVENFEDPQVPRSLTRWVRTQ